MRLGAIDVAGDFIKRGLAEADYKPVYENAITETKPLILSQLDRDLNTVGSHKSRRSRNPLPVAPLEDYAVN